MPEDSTPQDAPQGVQDAADKVEAGTPGDAEARDALGDAGKKALDAMKAERNEAAKALKAAQRELEALKASSMSEAEKAVAEAEKRGAQQAAERYATRLVDEAFRAATVGRALNPDALLAFDRKTFITDDGDVDRDALAAWVEQHAVPTGPRRPAGDADQGVRPGASDPGPGLARLRAAYASSSKSA